MENIIKHKLKSGGYYSHPCFYKMCQYCTTHKHLVEWTYQNCGACHFKLECLFQEEVNTMQVIPSQLSLNLATMILKEFDPDGKLGLTPKLDVETFKAPESEEIIVSRDLFEDFPGAAAFILVRDALRIMVSLDSNGDPEATYENSFWIENSGRFRDAAFTIIMGRFHEQYLGDDITGASFRLVDGKVACTFKPADGIDKAKMQLARAILKEGSKKGIKDKKGLLSLLAAAVGDED